MKAARRATEILSLTTAVWLMLLSPSARSDTPPTPDAMETASAEAPVVAVPVAEVPVDETPVAAVPAAEAPVAETPEVGTAVVETPVVETMVTDSPVAEPTVADTPAAETAVTETPEAETPVAETPVAETPVAETPVAETPVAETPVTIAPPPPGTLQSLVHPLWSNLSESQQQVLQPFASQWNTWSAAEKRSWVALANRVPRMKPVNQARAQRRISEWAQLTPGQRQIARQNYRLARQLLPRDERVAQYERYTQLTPEQQTVLRNSGWTSNTAALHAGARTGLAKEASQPLAPRQLHAPYP